MNGVNASTAKVCMITEQLGFFLTQYKCVSLSYRNEKVMLFLFIYLISIW